MVPKGFKIDSKKLSEKVHEIIFFEAKKKKFMSIFLRNRFY